MPVSIVSGRIESTHKCDFYLTLSAFVRDAECAERTVCEAYFTGVSFSDPAMVGGVGKTEISRCSLIGGIENGDKNYSSCCGRIYHMVGG